MCVGVAVPVSQIKVVPTIYEELNGDKHFSFQFTANTNEMVGQYQVPAVYFRWDLVRSVLLPGSFIVLFHFFLLSSFLVLMLTFLIAVNTLQSPITVKFEQRKESLSHFLVQVCAIVGGVFTVLGLVNAFIHNSVVQIKRRMGKLT